MDVQLSTEKPLFFGIHYMACSQTNLGKVHFLLVVGGWGGGGTGASEGSVISESEGHTSL